MQRTSFGRWCGVRRWAAVVAAVCCFGAALGQVGTGLVLLPAGVAYDAGGNLYFADTGRNQVFESTLGGALVVVAGTGEQGFGGDGGVAGSALLNGPESVAVGADGTVYIADTGNQRIRAVSGGVISTFAGTGVAGFGGDGGAAAGAVFRGPNALAIDLKGGLLICDSGNQRVRRVSGGVVTTVAGSGVQGFGGDGGQAVGALLDTPSGVAVGGDGRMFIADEHNDRIRVVGADGVMGTFAGTGVRGFGGDGGPAVGAKLALPRGVIVTAGGVVMFADSNNQRVRMVDTAGVIGTVAGSGVQGASADGDAGVGGVLDTPRSVGVSGFGSAVFAEPANGTLRELVASAAMYRPAGLVAPARVSVVGLSVPGTAAYGDAKAVVSVTGVAGTPQGVVQVLEGGVVVAQGSLVSGAATIALPAQGLGTVSVSAQYLGDGVNPAAVSAVASVSVGAAVVTATADAATIEYGQAAPVLTGTLAGVLAQDVGRVGAVWTAAGVLSGPLFSTPGVYPIRATLTGAASGNYSLVMAANSGALTIVKAATVTVEQSLAQGSFAGLPLVLSAQVGAANVRVPTAGVPTGVVNFVEGGNVVATGVVQGGVATATYLAPGAGSHAIVAAYGGDADFAASSSAAVTTVVGGVPDFGLSPVGSSTQTVLGGTVAMYSIAVAANPGPFTGAVTMSVSGLPKGATATFAPPVVIPGSGSAVVVMSVTTIAHAMNERGLGEWAVWALVLPLLWMGRRRRGWVVACVVMVLVGGAVGCGDRTVPDGAVNSVSSTLMVTGTSTNLVGAVVTHSTGVTLVVQ